jgi:hypothetical protein
MAQTTTIKAGVPPLARRLSQWRPRSARLVVAGALTAWFAFRAGGFFAGPVGLGAAALAVALLLQSTLARRPFAGWSPTATVVAVAGVGLACWVLLSAGWSDAPARALLEFDRVLLYLLAFVLLALVARRAGDLAVLLRWTLLAIVAAAVVGLATRLLPDAFGAVSQIEPARLSYPLTYWNAMSVCCALGAVLALHAASGEHEPPWMRVLAAAALPILALGIYFPLSRGGIATAVVGVLAYIVLARPRLLLVTALTAGPPTAVAVVSAYGAGVVTSARYFAGGGPAEGHRVAIVLVACSVAAGLLRLVALSLDRRLSRMRDRHLGVRGWVGVAVAAVLVMVALGAAIDAPARLHAQYDGFVHGNVIDPGPDARSRLTASGNNGRIAMWRVARAAFTAEPVHGIGAGTYQLAWQRDRPNGFKVFDAHSLYLESLAELGVVGLGLLLVLLGGILFAFAAGLRGAERQVHAAALAAAVALLVHAAIDWDWEMPVLFCWLFAAGGVACARPVSATVAGERGLEPARLTRVIAGLACLLLATTPALIAASDARLRQANAAFARGDCPRAIDAALGSRDALSVRPEPFELLGYCDLRSGQWTLAVRAMRSAEARDPGSWRYVYGVAVAQALAGQDPRPAIARARRLNPRAPEAIELADALRRTDRPRAWARAAARARLPTS